MAADTAVDNCPYYANHTRALCCWLFDQLACGFFLSVIIIRHQHARRHTHTPSQVWTLTTYFFMLR